MDIILNKENYKFIYRVSVVIFNKDASKVLLFNVEGRDFYMTVGGKVAEKEESLTAIKREVKEELNYELTNYRLLAVSEEFVESKGSYNQQIDLIYQATYNDEITTSYFKGLEGAWINFEWIDIKNLNSYKIYPHQIVEAIKNPNKIYHFIENLTK